MIRKATTYYLNSYKGLSQEIWLLSFVNLVNRCGTMVIPFMMLYLTSDLNCSLSQAGIVMSIWGIGAFIGAYFGGKLTDKIGFHKVQLTALLLGGIGFIILGQLKHYYTICIVTFFLAMVNEAFRPANSAAIGKYSTKENQIRSFTLMRLSFNLGWALGGGIGGFVAHRSYELLFWIDGFTNIFACLLLWKLLPDELPTTSTAEVNETKNFSIWNDKAFIRFIFISVVYFVCFVQLFTNLPVYFKREMHLEENYIGYLASWNGLLIVLLEMAIIFWVQNNWTQKRAVIVGVFLHAIAYALPVFFNLNFFGAFIMMTFITLSEIFAFSILVNFWMNRTNDFNRGQYAAAWTMMWAFSQTFGPPIASFIADYINFKVLWAIIMVLSLIATYLYSKIFQEQ